MRDFLASIRARRAASSTQNPQVAQLHDRALTLLRAAVRTGNPTALGEAIALVREDAMGLLDFAMPNRDAGGLEDAVALLQAARAASRGHPYHETVVSDLGMTLWGLYQCTGDPATLDEAVATTRQAAHLTSPHHSDFARRLTTFGNTLRAHYERTRDLNVLEEAITAIRQAVNASPRDDPHRVLMLLHLGNALRTRYEHTCELVHLDDAISTYQEAAQTASPGHPDHAGCLSHLCNVLYARYEHVGNLEALGVYRQAVQAIPLDHPDRVRHLSTLSRALADRDERTGDVAMLDEAIRVFREILRTTPPNHPELARRLSDLGIALNSRFIRTGDASAIREAASIHLQVVKTTQPHDPDRVTALCDLGVAQAICYVSTGEPADLQYTLSVCRQAVNTIPPDHPAVGYLDTYEAIGIGTRALQVTRPGSADLARRLRVLGDALRLRCTLTADPSPLDDTIAAYRQAVEAARPDDPDRATYLFWLGSVLIGRYDLTRDSADLGNAVATLQQAVEATPPDHPDYATYLLALYQVRATPHVNSTDLADLDESVSICQQSVEIIPSDHPDYAARLSDLANALYARCERTHSVDRLDGAVSVCRQAVQATAPDSPHLAQRLRLLGDALRLFVAGDLSQDEEAIAVYRQAVEAARPDDPDRGTYLFWLATCLHGRHELTHDTADLDDAITAYRQAAEATPPDHPDHAWRLSSLSIALDSRFVHAGDLADLHEAIRIGRQTVGATPPDHPDHARRLSDLASALNSRFRHTGDSATLDEAIRTCRQAVEFIPPGHAERATCLSELGVGLRARFQRTGDSASLDEAIRCGRQAVEVATPDHPHRVRCLSELAGSLHVRHRSGGDLDDLDEAIMIDRQIIKRSDLWIHLANLGDHLLARYQSTIDPRNWFKTFQKAARLTPSDDLDRSSKPPDFATLFPGLAPKGGLADLDEAITVYRRAVRAVPSDRPDQAGMLDSLGFALFEHQRHAQPVLRLHQCALDEPPSLEEALAAVRRAAGIADAPTLDRVRAGGNWGRWAAAAGRWTEAAEGFRCAVELLPRLAPRHLQRSDQEHLLGLTSGLVSDAAACAVQCGDAEGALVLLEQGRGILLSHALDSRSDLTDLHAVAPELVGKLIRLREELDSPTTPLPLGTHADRSAAEQRMTDLRHQHGREWRETVQQIRALPGFARFLQPPRLGDLLPAAAEGPVVTVNVSEFRCDALVLTIDGVRVVPLRDLKRDELHKQVSRFGDALPIADDSWHGLADQMTAQATIRATLGWLWDTIAGPVLADLGRTEPPPLGEPWPRVWWSPTGMLNFLPLHAAGHHGQHTPQPATVIDRVVSSYTPTIRALQHARTRLAPPPGTQRLLVVAMPDTPGQQRLPGASAEAAAIARRLPGPSPLIGPDAIRDNVLAALRESAWAHFACHAHSDPTNPSTSCLLLHDQPVTVADVSRLRLDHAELAYLSACATGRGGLRLADEAIHIASAFQLAGYTHVVATLWPIGDNTAVDAALGFYDRLHLTPNGTDSPRVALALHEAMRDLRDIHPLLATDWGAYVHAGP